MANDLDLDGPAWRFALALSRRPEVSAECLRLQDGFGLDVSLMLVCLWLGQERGLHLDAALYGKARERAAGWTALAVQPLRTVRRGVKASDAVARPAVQAFRALVQKAEIEAERIEIALLGEWAASLGDASAGEAGPEAALHNLRLVLATAGAEPDAAPAVARALGDIHA